MKTFILALLVFAFLSNNSWAEKIELPPCTSFEVGDDFFAICKVRCTILRPDIPLYYWILYRKDKKERAY